MSGKTKKGNRKAFAGKPVKDSFTEKHAKTMVKQTIRKAPPSTKK